MSELPKGWATCELQQIVEVLDSRRIPLNSDERATRIEGKPISALFPYYGATGQVGYIDDYIFDEPLILLGEDGVPFFDPYKHKAYRVTGKTWVNNHAHVLKPIPDGCDGRFLEAHLNACDYSGHVTGTTRLKLTQGAMNKLPVPLAPLPEQKRIADKLDSTLARVEACRDRLDRLPALLKRFRQSILSAATSGRLTEDWRTTPSPDEAQRNPGTAATDSDADSPASDLPECWRQTDVQSVAQVGTGSTPIRSHPAFYADTGTPWITSSATSQELVTSAEQFVTAEAIAAHRLKTYPVGTLLVAMYGEGKTRGQVTELGIPATINQACAAVVVDESRALKAYVKFALQANYIEMRELAEGGNQPNLNLSKIKEFPLALPSITEQHEIIRRVETLFAFADRLEARINTARKQAEQLTPALLAKAFRGELVPQDPNDEPASELLKRLATTRSEAPKAKRGRKATT